MRKIIFKELEIEVMINIIIMIEINIIIMISILDNKRRRDNKN